jgi:hypothetical protein
MNIRIVIEGEVKGYLDKKGITRFFKPSIEKQLNAWVMANLVWDTIEITRIEETKQSHNITLKCKEDKSYTEVIPFKRAGMGV